jgi:multiple sugar transport system substrate-binding protein
LRQIANAFQACHPKIKIVFGTISFPTYFQKLEGRASKGSLPDVFWMNGLNFALFAADGFLTPLDSQIRAGHLNLSNYPSRLVNLYTYKGMHYALSKDFDVIGLWYNKAIFRAAHLIYPVAYPVSQKTAQWNALETTYFTKAWRGRWTFPGPRR